jgi:hypothetical protein
MLDTSSDFKSAVYAQERQFKGRASIKMDAFNDIDPRAFELTADLNYKVAGSTAENPHIGMYVKSSLLRPPDYTGNAEANQAGYNSMGVDDTSYYHIATTTLGTMSQAIFRFNVIAMLEEQFGSVLWGGKTALADKIAITKTLLTQASCTLLGYGVAPTRPVFRNFRYIRDWLNGNTVNANNYWNEIQCMAGATNRAAGKTPTISSGTLTNGVNITNGVTSDYGYEASGNGVAKYIQIDLGSVYYDIDTIKVFHYYADGRTFHGTKTEISIDGVNWIPIFDSAVSGEYVETSAGKTYVGSTGGSGLYLTVWNDVTNAYSLETKISGTTVGSGSRITLGITSVVDTEGYINFMAYALSADGTTASDVYVDYVSIVLDGNLKDVRVFDDDLLVRFSMIEEMTTLNDTLPSNELTITFDNSSGELDLLNFANMQKVIASKPEIRLETGLVTSNIEAGTLMANFAGKLRADNESNPHAAWYISGGRNTQLLPTDVLTEFSQGAYDELELADAWTIGINTTLTAGNMAQYVFSFNILEMLERQLGPQIWRNKTDLADKVAVARALVSRIDFRVDGKGSSYANTLASLYRWNLTSWYAVGSTTSTSVATVSNYTSSAYNAIDDNGFFHMLFTSDPSDGVTASNITADYAEITVTYDSIYAVEWVPMGTYFLTDWQNDVTSRIVSMTCHDYFQNLGDISYNPTATTNLGTLAQEVLAAGGVPSDKWLIDGSLYNITVNKFPERLDCRTALQHIGIAARAAVFQDRDGNIVIKPFAAIDEITNYIVYPSTQPSLYGYLGPNEYMTNSTAGGMKYIDFEQMYDAPQVSLQKSVYQLVVKIYNIVNADGGLDASEQVYTNASIEGTSGESFTIDNPLVKDTSMANDIADWYIGESNFNATYSVNWRQNPVLECADLILVEDSFGAEKQTRITHNQFDYEGYLTGITESKGGV